MSQKFQARDVPVSILLECHSGNTGLTEEEIYQRIEVEGPRYEVLSASTEAETRLGVIPKCMLNGKMLEVFEDREGILVIRNGKAGTTFYLDKGKYAITDHAYILSLKTDCPYKVSLKWLMVQYRQTFLSYSSGADNATWNMTGFFEEAKIDIPDYSEQEEIVRDYDKLQSLKASLMALENRIDHLLNYQVIPD